MSGVPRSGPSPGPNVAYAVHGQQQQQQQQQPPSSFLHPPSSPASFTHGPSSPQPFASQSQSPGPISASPSTATTGLTPHSQLSPPSGVPQWQTRQVSETLFDFMHGEIIRYFTAQMQAVSKTTDPRVSSRRLHAKLESMGFGVGCRFVERVGRDHPSLDTQLDVVKFICKELWSMMYKKQIDKLQTNYKGIYVLHDTNFRWLQKLSALSVDVDAPALIEQARIYTSLACGILRGALWNLGLSATVKADIHKLPAVQFTICEEKAAAATAAAAAQSGKTNSGTTNSGSRPGSGQGTTTTAGARRPSSSGVAPPAPRPAPTSGRG